MEVNKNRLPRLLFITQPVPGLSPPALVKRVCEGGVRMVQLRMKNASEEEIRKRAKEVEGVCHQSETILVINDHVEIAREVGAEGVHVGKGDMAPDEARRLLGKRALIGGTANSIEDIRAHAQKGVDYIGLGPYRQTDTKEELEPILGLQGYRDVIKKCELEGIGLPIYAIGGIRVEDVLPLLQTGVHGVAVSSTIAKAEDIPKAAEDFAKAVQQGALGWKRGSLDN